MLPIDFYESQKMTTSSMGPLPLMRMAEVAQHITRGEMPRIIALSGDLGAGKTTLVKEILKQLGVGEEVSSPTFGIINEYETADHRKVCHSDWYRIKNADELLDTGIQEYLHDPDCIVLIEWPEVGEALLIGEEALFINIEHAGEERVYHLGLRH